MEKKKTSVLKKISSANEKKKERKDEKFHGIQIFSEKQRTTDSNITTLHV